MTAVSRAGCTNIKDPVNHVERFVDPISLSGVSCLPSCGAELSGSTKFLSVVDTESFPILGMNSNSVGIFSRKNETIFDTVQNVQS